MQHHPAPPAPRAGMTLGDIYHILFRHKWKILAVWAAGFVALIVLWQAWPVRYRSAAKIFVRYVFDNKSLSLADNSNIQTPERGGQGIINSEVEILTSLDLALRVADAVGPAKILAKTGRGGDRHAAAGMIRAGLKVEPPLRGSVIHIAFEHPDQTVVQPVLSQLIASYYEKHAEIHQSAGTLYDFLTQKTDQLRTQLAQTEQELRKVKSSVGVVSLDDSKRACTERLTQLQTDLANAEAQLAEHRAVLNDTNELVSASLATNTSPAAFAPPEKEAEHRRVCALLADLETTERKLLLQYLPASPLVVEVRAQIADAEAQKRQLEEEYPLLSGTHSVERVGGSSTQSADIMLFELRKAKALQARMGVINDLIAKVRQEITALDAVEGTITDLQRKGDLQEQNLRLFQVNLEQARIDETLGSDRISNISTIQTPSPPFQDSDPLIKACLLLVAAAFAAGIGLAFVTELYLDRSFTRPRQVESRLGLPLFLAIPQTDLNGRHRFGLSRFRLLTAGGHQPGANGDGADGGTSVTMPARPERRLQAYFEALRDRLIMFFELKNMTHKPKLVAVTSCGTGSGVTTVASGLAASLSEVGDGNVLLVDMNQERGAAHYFYKGELACGLDEALESDKRNGALVQENLYVVTEKAQNDKLPRILHKRFSHLMPKLKASDYDYIIFDMPPISHLSATPKLARFMDMVLMVVEAEKTDRDLVEQASAMLAESKTNVAVVLNKNRTYVPHQLQQNL